MVWNMFKVNNKGTRTTPVAFILAPVSLLLTSSVSIVSFEQVNADLDNVKGTVMQILKLLYMFVFM